MRWVFIRPGNNGPYYDPELQEPLGLEYLAASRLEKGEPVLLLDCALNSLSDVQTARRAAAFQPDVIGFSIMTVNELESAHSIHAEAVKCLNGQPVRWIAGGNFISTESPAGRAMLPEGMTLVQFEGERALDDLARLWQENPHVPPQGAMVQEPSPVYSTDPVTDLDSLAFPVRVFADLILGSGWAFNLQGSRGCCGSCHYCASPGMARSASNKWRGRSPESVVDEIARLSSHHGAYSFNFVDEDFLGPEPVAEQRARQFTDALHRRDLKISFGIQVRPHTLTDKIIDMLTASGLTFVFMGIEFDDPADFKRWGRRWVADQWRFVRRLQELGVEVNAGVMLFHSHSTLEGIRSFADKLHQHRLLNHRSATNRLDAMPGSIAYRKAVREGIFPRNAYGPQPLPFVHSEAGALYTDVKSAVDPLGPTSMHALCSLPPLLALRRFNTSLEPVVRRLREIIDLHDRAVAQSLFALLEAYEGSTRPEGLVSRLRKANLATALEGVKALVAHGFADSSDELREAIRVDAGC